MSGFDDIIRKASRRRPHLAEELSEEADAYQMQRDAAESRLATLTAENERLRAEARELSEEADAYQMQRDAAESRLATAVGLLQTTTDLLESYGSTSVTARSRAFLASAQPAQPKEGES